MSKNNNTNYTNTNPEAIKAEKIEFSGEILLRERIDEETKAKKYSVGIFMNNPFVDLFEGGRENEYNLKISLGFKDTQAKVKAQFMYKAKQLLASTDKIEFKGFIQRRKFYDNGKYKWVRYIGIFINSPFDDGVVSLTIPRAETLGLLEMFANEKLAAIS